MESHVKRATGKCLFSSIELLVTLVAVGLMLVASGCGGGTDLGAVTGQVTKSGQPQAKLWVRFAPAAGGRPAEAVTDNEGRYELSYTGKKKGALVGPQRVSIMSGGEIDGRGNELSPRKEVYSGEVEVESGSNEFNFEI
jgi:hypothetical protein